MRMNSFFKEKFISVFLLIILVSWIFLLPFHSHEDPSEGKCDKECKSHCSSCASLFSLHKKNIFPFQNSYPVYKTLNKKGYCPYCDLSELYENIFFALNALFEKIEFKIHESSFPECFEVQGKIDYVNARGPPSLV